MEHAGILGKCDEGKEKRQIIPGGEGPRGLWNGSNVKGAEGQDRGVGRGRKRPHLSAL